MESRRKVDESLSLRCRPNALQASGSEPNRQKKVMTLHEKEKLLDMFREGVRFVVEKEVKDEQASSLDWFREASKDILIC
ncbi:Hypothetical predicted protein [Octopus vulgaris]|uniref:Uncharacterized protein n=1 Tax=Octopus vulgaris TaxID=6645 RepID=A0AA36AUA0_OCTVU|nr:Hypothetical predicted protein [Octopus vulgaris]